MDKTTYSTRGPTCTSCKNGGATPAPTPAPTTAPTRAPAPGPNPSPNPAPTRAPAPGPNPSPNPAPNPSPNPGPAPSTKGKFCGFEQSSRPYCGIWSDAKGDKFDWTRKNRGTSSGGTGPSKAQEGQYYIYTETSYPRRKGDNAILETTTGTLGSGGYLEFKYNMYGRSTGSLKVKGNGAVLWEKSGEQNNPLIWNTARVDFDKHQLTGSVKLEFEGTRGSSYTGDMAIDAVTLYEGGSSPAPTPAPAPASTTTYQRYTTQAPAPASTTPAPAPAPAPYTTQAPAPASTTTAYQPAPAPAPMPPSTTNQPSPTPTPYTTQAPTPATTPAPAPAPPGSNQDVVNRLTTAEGLLRKILSKIR
jgi:outer membrane biosynthesis protein TonB